MALLKARQREQYTLEPQPGLTVGTVPWMRRHDVAAVAIDTMAMEVYPCEDADVLFPVHLLQLRDMGLTQGQNFDLEEVSAHCAADGTYEMLLVRSEEHTSELKSLMRISYAVFCSKKKKQYSNKL